MTPFLDNESGVLNCAGRSKFMGLGEVDWAGGLVKRVDVKEAI